MLVDEQLRVLYLLTSSYVIGPGGHFATYCGDSEVWLVVTYYCAVLARGDRNSCPQLLYQNTTLAGRKSLF